MNCPLCKKHLLEIDVDSECDFFCSERVSFNACNSLSHFEWRSGDSKYIVRSPPYILYIEENISEVYMADWNGKYPLEMLFSINSLNKSNLNNFIKDYKCFSVKIKNLIIFS